MKPLHLQSKLVGMVVLALALASVPFKTNASDPYEIDVVVSTTGTIAFMGNSISKVLSLVEDRVNKSGGIRGRDLKFVYLDDQSTPANAVQIVNKIIASKAAVMLGTSLNATCSAMAPLLSNGPVDLCFTPGIHPENGSYVFSPAPSTTDLAISTGRYMKNRGWKKVAFLFSTDGSGVDGEKVVTATFQSPEMKNVAIASIEHFAITDLSVSAQMTRIKAAQPEALYVWASGTASQTALRGIQDAGLAIPIIISYSNATASQMATFKGYTPKELLSSGLPSMVPPDQLPAGKMRDAVAQYYAAFKTAGLQPDVTQATPWDAAAIVVAALRKLGPNATAAQIRSYIANLSGWTGVTGTYDFKTIPQRGVNWKSVVMTRWDATRETWVSAETNREGG
jgi:branched-chain amino acid transport system substrate-binding protein